MRQPVYVITGQVSAGKSTLAAALLARHARGIHLDVDVLRELVTVGRSDPIHWTDETGRQFDLALRSAAASAAIYHDAGFAVAIEGSVDPAAVAAHLAAAGVGDAIVGVMLHPDVETAILRNRSRQNKTFDTSVLDDVIRRLDADLTAAPVPDGWLRIDNAAEPPDATVQRVRTWAGIDDDRA